MLKNDLFYILKSEKSFSTCLSILWYLKAAKNSQKI